VFKERKVFDTDKIKPGMVAKLTPMVRAQGDEWPGKLKNGPNYGIITGATMEQVDLMVFNYFEHERRQDSAELFQLAPGYPMRKMSIKIDETTGHIPAFRLEVLEP